MENNFDPNTGVFIGGDVSQVDQQVNQQPDMQAYQQVNQQPDMQVYQQVNQQPDMQAYQQVNQQPDMQAYQQVNQQLDMQQVFQQQPVQPSKKKGSKKVLKGIGIAFLIIAIVSIAVFVGIQVLFLSPVQKIKRAWSNTMVTGQLQKDLNFQDILAKDKLAFDVAVEVDGTKVGLEGAYQKKKDVFSINGNLYVDSQAADFEMEGIAELEKGKFAFSIPKIQDDVFVYYYTKKNKGDLVDVYEDEFKIASEYLKTLYEVIYGKNQYSEDLNTAIMKEINELEFEKVKEEKFEVNSKDVTCGGYQVKVTGKNLKNIIKNVKKVFIDYYEDMYEAMDIDAEEYFDSLYEDFLDDIDNKDKMEISFFIYRNKLACIRAELEEGTLEWLFLGGDYPAQNMKLVAIEGKDKEVVLEVKGSAKKNKETLEIIFVGEKVFEIEYNSKTGAIELHGEDIRVKAVLEHSDKEIKLVIDKFKYEDESFAASIAFSEDAKVKKLSGDEIDLGDISEEKWEDISEDIQEYFETFNY